MAERHHSNAGGRLSVPMIALLIAAMALGFYWDHTYSGPYRWIAELQLRWFGVYEKSITFLLAIMLTLAPIGAIAVVYRLATRGRRDGAVGETPVGAPPPPEAAAPQAVAAPRFDRYLTPGIFLLMGVVLGVMAVQNWRTARNAVELVNATAGQYEAGQNPGTWVRVAGRPLVEQVLTTESKGSREHYIPLVSDDWSEGRPVHVFVEVYEKTADPEALRAAATDGYMGMSKKGGLPGMVRVAFERDGLPPAADHYMIKFGRTPADERRIARDASLFSGALVLAAVAWFVVDRLRARRPARAVAAPAEAAPALQHQIKSIVTVDGIDPSRRP